MLKHKLSQLLKLIKNNEFDHLGNNLTKIIYFLVYIF
jgi:hypothetical protein